MLHTIQTVPFLFFPFCSIVAAATIQCVTKNLILKKLSLLSVSYKTMAHSIIFISLPPLKHV